MRKQKFLIRTTALLLTMVSTVASVVKAAPPAITPRTRDAIAHLGALLFNDVSLSADSRVSCARCHQPDHVFSDSRSLAEGAYGMKGTRNAPSLLNAADRTTLFWDGRRSSLEELMLDPLLGPREHGLRDADELVSRIDGDRAMRAAYAVAFGSRAPLSAKNLARSLAAYVSTLRTSESLFDRYISGKDSSALDAKEVHGYELFKGRAGCSACHLIGPTSAPLTDAQFHNQGIGASYLQSNMRAVIDRALTIEPKDLGNVIQTDPQVGALGRFLVTRKSIDIGAFRTPSLNNVSRSAPYMHDGSISTLEDAVKHELYYSAADRGANFSHAELEALVAFLETLADQSRSTVSPLEPPS